MASSLAGRERAPRLTASVRSAPGRATQKKEAASTSTEGAAAAVEADAPTLAKAIAATLPAARALATVKTSFVNLQMTSSITAKTS